MGRSVNVPYNADVVTYIDVSDIEEDDEYQWEDMLQNIIYQLKDKMPSLYESNEWLGNEEKILLENCFAYIGVCTYGSIISLWIVPKDQHLDLAYNWISKIAHHVKKLGDFIKDGTMSNGVSVYKRKEE